MSPLSLTGDLIATLLSFLVHISGVAFAHRLLKHVTLITFASVCVYVVCMCTCLVT